MTDESHPEVVRTLRATSGKVSFLICILLAAFLLGDVVIRGNWGQALLLAPWILLGLWIVYEIAYVSMVRIDGQGVLVQNMLRRTSFGWRRASDIDLRWQLVFTLEDGRDVTCYGGPAKARPVRKPSRDEAAAAPAGLRTLTEIRDLWSAAPATADAPILRTWDRPAILALALIVAWAVASVVIASA